MNQPHAVNWNPCLEQAALSDIGLRRANNQDSMAVAVAPTREKFEKRGHLFVVADGMGAHAAGELASKLAADIIPLTYDKLVDRAPAAALLEAVLEANRQIHNRGQASDDFKGMGTTIDALALLPEGAIVAHVGDSRVYRWRNHRLEQLTFDHSLVWEMRAAGQLAKEDIPPYVPRNIITRSMGPNPDVRADMEGPFPVEAGDVFLLCSDGLSGTVEDEEIGKILGSLPPHEAVHALVDLANLRGGPDNITAIVVRATCPSNAGGGPARAESRGPAAGIRPLPLLLWGLCGALAVVAAASLAAGNPLGVLIGALGAVAAGGAALSRRRRPGTLSPPRGQVLGHAPYAQFDCTPDAKFTRQLSDLATQLRDAAVSDAWIVAWDRFNDLETEARTAAEAGDYRRAVTAYCRAISFMMEQLKHQRGTAEG